MLINLSNHPSHQWSKEQIEAARSYGEIVDLPFPFVDAAADELSIANLVEEYVDKVLHLSQGNSVAVHLMGEMTFTFALVGRLQQHNITCVASTTERVVEIAPDGAKTSHFQFVRFRNYQ